MIHRVASATVSGIEGLPVTVEVDVRRGLPCLQVVGLPAASLRESRERVMTAVRNSGLPWPAGRVTVNLLPADERKDGAAAELAMAVAITVAAGGTGPPPERAAAVLLGELSLDGTVRPVRGLLAMVTAVAAAGHRCCLVPQRQAGAAARVPGIRVHGVATLAEAVAWYGGTANLPLAAPAVPRPEPPPSRKASGWFSLVPARARRVAEIAAAGRHHLLLVGPPGSGKTVLAWWIGRLQPSLSAAEALAVACIHGAAGLLPDGDWPRRRPFRAPHHSTTRAGLLGGGAPCRPGEVTLAHHGVLFLDELTEFAPMVLEGLREPLQEGRVAISRVGGGRRWPAAFQMVAAANPCRCGYAGSCRRTCRCGPADLERYRRRLSGPLLDRVDLFLELAEPEDWHVAGDRQAAARERELVAVTRNRITAAREVLARRHTEARDGTIPWAGLDEGAIRILEAAATRLSLSRRALARCVAVAETVAALAGRSRPGAADMAEALGYRRGAVSLWSAGETPVGPGHAAGN